MGKKNNINANHQKRPITTSCSGVAPTPNKILSLSSNSIQNKKRRLSSSLTVTTTKVNMNMKTKLSSNNDNIYKNQNQKKKTATTPRRSSSSSSSLSTMTRTKPAAAAAATATALIKSTKSNNNCQGKRIIIKNIQQSVTTTPCPSSVRQVSITTTMIMIIEGINYVYHHPVPTNVLAGVIVKFL